VVFSDEALDVFALCSDSLMFFGKSHEIFGLVYNGAIGRAQVEAVAHRAHGWGRKVGISAKLWHMYRAHNGIGMRKHEIGAGFHKIADYTQDLDRPVEYDRFLKEHAWARA